MRITRQLGEASLMLRSPWVLGCIVPILLAAGCRTPLSAEHQTRVREALATEIRGPSDSLRVAAALQDLRNAGVESAELLFNEGNAWRRANRPGRAIACYRQAMRLAPRRDDVRFNLNRLLQQQGLPGEDGLWRQLRIESWLGANERPWFLGGCLLWASLLACRRVAFGRRPWGRWTIMWVLIGASLLARDRVVAYRRARALDVIAVEDARLRQGPALGFETIEAGQLIRGQSLSVVERTDRWLFVRPVQGRPGWLHVSATVAY